MRKSLTWKVAVAGGAVLGAGFGSLALAGADDPETPDKVQLQASAGQSLRNPGSVVSVVPSGVRDPGSATATAGASVNASVNSPAAPAAPTAQSAPSALSAHSPASPASPAIAPAPAVEAPAPAVQAPAPAPAPAADSPASPVSAPDPASAPSAASAAS